MNQPLTIEQAIRNAVEIERAAAGFYRRLLGGTRRQDAREFLTDLAAEEDAHARAVSAMAERVAHGELPSAADHSVEAVESAPGWAWKENISIRQAMQVALEAEEHAQLYYETLSQATEGVLQEFFAGLARAEAGHVVRVRFAIEAWE